MLGEEIPCRCLHKHLVDPIYKVASSWKYQRTLVGHVGPFDLLSDSFPNIRCCWCRCGLVRSWMQNASVSACVIASALRKQQLSMPRNFYEGYRFSDAKRGHYSPSHGMANISLFGWLKIWDVRRRINRLCEQDNFAWFFTVGFCVLFVCFIQPASPKTHVRKSCFFTCQGGRRHFQILGWLGAASLKSRWL